MIGGTMKKYLILLFVFAILTLGCNKTTEVVLTEQQKKMLSKEVEARVLDYMDAVQNLDLERMLDFWSNSEGFAMAGDGILTVGYDKYAAQLKEIIPNTREINQFEKKNPQIYVLANDAVSYAFEFKWSMTMASGDTTNAKGSWLYVFKKFDDTWRVIHSGGTHIYN